MVADIELIESSDMLQGFRFPYKVEKVIQIVVTQGRFSSLVDFYSYTLEAPAMAIFLPGQVIESMEVDSDFAGFGMVIGAEFTDSLNLPVSLQERLFLKNTQFHSLTSEMLEAYMACYRQVARVLKQQDNPYRAEIIKHLFSAYYYGLGYYSHTLRSQPSMMTTQQKLCDNFILLVSENFKAHRTIDFYADRLCVSSKYLSTLLRQHTGMTALEWIERYVVLYAKSCLSSTTMTIQQISDELDFPSQSVFGKYFKRVEGVSPKSYRNSLIQRA